MGLENPRGSYWSGGRIPPLARLRHVRGLTVALALALVLAACGGADDDPGEEPADAPEDVDTPEDDDAPEDDDDASEEEATGVRSPDEIDFPEGFAILLTWGGVWTDAEEAAYGAPLLEEYGVELEYETPVEFAKWRAIAETSVIDFDVVAMNVRDIERIAELDLLEPYDWSIIDKSSKHPDQFTLSEGTVAEEMEFLQNTSLVTHLAYLDESFPDGTGPQTWADFWDVENFPGERSLQDVPWNNIEFALVADGMSWDEINPLTDEKIDRAFDKLDEIRPHIRVWWTGGAQSEQLIGDGEVDMMSIWNGRATSVRDRGIDVTQVWEGGGVMSDSAWVVVKGTPRVNEAMALIEVATRGENQAVFARALDYGPTDPAGFDFLTEEEAEQQPTNPDYMPFQIIPDADYYAQNLDELELRWQQWQAGG